MLPLLAAGEHVADAADAQETVTGKYRKALREAAGGVASMTVDDTAEDAAP